jgi:glycosyltransferase involved in cell wall biosynthesis
MSNGKTFAQKSKAFKFTDMIWYGAGDIGENYTGYRKVKKLLVNMEAFGIVYIEAMAANTPIIVTRDERIAELISEGENGLLVDAKSINSIVEAIDKLITNPDLRKKIAKNGTIIVQDKLTWENNARAYIELMSSVLSRKQ